MKTIIMDNFVTEAPGSLFPRVNVTASEAEVLCAELGGRLPTSEEYDALFAKRPWPHLIYEWTSTPIDDSRVVRGGAWDYGPSDARASSRDRSGPACRGDYVGFRCAREIPDDAEVPPGWVCLT